MEKMYSYSLYVLLIVNVFNGICNVAARAVNDYYDDNGIENEIVVPGENDLVVKNDVLQSNQHGLINDVAFRLTPPAKLIQKPGTVIDIACEVVGKPLPTVEWIVGRYPIEEIERPSSNVIPQTNTNVFGKVRAVHVIDYTLTKPHVYTCVAHGEFKSIYASTIVYPMKGVNNIKDLDRLNDKMSSIKPKITYTHRTYCDVIGASAILPCKVHARPNAEITWLDSKKHPIEQNQHYKILPSGDLIITELQWSDTGKFHCVATNALGVDTAQVSLYTMAKN